MAWFVPMIAAAGPVLQGAAQQSADDTNAGFYNQEARIARAQGYAAEETQRRKGATDIGAMTAAAGEAGAGYGGSTGRSIGQSAMNEELDALNIRYKQNLQGWSYDTQANNLRQQGKQALVSGFLNAGAAFLKSRANYSGGGSDSIDLS